MLRWSIGILFAILSSASLAAVKGEEVQYRADGVTMKGYLAYDDAVKGKRPGILVVHEWWGHNDYSRQRARMLAEMGYTALAVDMYGDGKQANHPDDAKKFSGALRTNADGAKQRFQAAEKLLRQHKTVDGKHLGAIGYCLGGGVVLEMARVGEKLAGVASFHGSLGTSAPAQKGKVKAQMLVLNGADDPFVTAEQIGNFKKEMDAAGVKYRFINYPGAKHSFTNPVADKYAEQFKMPVAYNADADKQSWAEMSKFFDGLFKKK
ncbi:MAG: dienelactone hydrolase family protein [Gammaproteobacteria bacterium]|nr:dienelactone hydrolase family protein [Gammaproteobacteria bacterium]